MLSLTDTHTQSYRYKLSHVFAHTDLFIHMFTLSHPYKQRQQNWPWQIVTVLLVVFSVIPFPAFIQTHEEHTYIQVHEYLSLSLSYTPSLTLAHLS